MALTIYGAAASRTSRVLWAVEELGIPYEHVPVNHRLGESRKPEHLSLNPNGHIPVIKDGEVVLWESLAINLYLAKKYGGALALKSVEDEGRAIMWSMWALTEVEPHSNGLLQHTMMLPEDKRQPAIVSAAKEGVKAPLNVLEGVLGKSDYLLGSAFSVADLNVSSLVSTLTRVQYDLAAWPKVAAWLAKCSNRPAMAKVRAMVAH